MKSSVKSLDSKCNNLYKESFNFETINISYGNMKKR